MGLLGSAIGKLAGGIIGKKLGNQKAGEEIGGAVGTVAPGFKTGGAVKRTGKALVHKGEYVLPKGVKPTAAQRKAVAKRKADARKKK